MPFQAGDLVKVVEAAHPIKLNHEYEVERMEERHDGDMRVYLKGVDNDGVGWYTRRFQLVDKRRYIRGDAFPEGGFKVGDEIFINPNPQVSGVYLKNFNQETPYTIRRIEHDIPLKDSLLYFVGRGGAQGVCQFRFLPAIPDTTILPKDRVVVDWDSSLNKRDPVLPADGKVYTVKSGKQWLTLEGFPGQRFHVKRFKLRWVVGGGAVAPVVKPKPNLFDIREKLTEIVEKKGQTSICSYGTLYTDGTFNEQVNDVCHARLTMKPYYLKDASAGVHSAALIVKRSADILRNKFKVKDVNAYLELYKMYLHYILNESPWAITFLTKDVNEAFEKGILMNIDVHRNWIMGGAVATREGVEFSGRLPVFKKVLDMGFSGNVAYLCSMYLTGTLDGKDFTEGNCGGGHQALNGHHPWEGLKQFFAKGYKEKPNLLPFRKQQGSYYIAIAAIEGYTYTEHDWGWVAKKDDKMVTHFERNCPKNVEGEGFMERHVINEASLKTLATFIDNELKGVE